MVIRVGIIGLSASSGTWAASAHVKPLQSEPLSSKYTLNALATSSAESAAKSAKCWGVEPSKAYAGATKISKDEDVDLVVVSVKLPHHRDLALPPLRAGKDVFVEWPLATTLEQVDELLAAAKVGGGKTYVGLQARTMPAVLKAKELIASGALGKICASTIVALDSVLLTLPPAYDYEHESRNRADVSTITSGHVLDAQAFLLGEYEHITSQHSCFYPTITTPHHTGPVHRDAPDSLLVQGKLLSGAMASFSLISTLPGSPSSFSWTITGSKGTLRFEGSNINIQIWAPTLYLSPSAAGTLGASKKGLRTSLEGNEWVEVEVDAPKTSSQTGDLYAAIAGVGKVVEGSIVDFEGARLRHRMLEACMRSAREGTKETYL